jgi:hypothetical protein
VKWESQNKVKKKEGYVILDASKQTHKDFIASDALHSRRRRRTNEHPSPSRPQMSVIAPFTLTSSELNDNTDGNRDTWVQVGLFANARERGLLSDTITWPLHVYDIHLAATELTE